MHPLSLYRKRFIPEETVHLKDDIILFHDDHLIVTKWTTLHPRKDINNGISAYYMDKGVKVSKVFDKDHRLVYWYCDIIQVKKDLKQNTFIFEDLLIDVVIQEDGRVKILDLDELADALDLHLITGEEVKYALRALDFLLKTIDQGQFDDLKEPVNRAEQV